MSSHFHLARYVPGDPPAVLPGLHDTLWFALADLAVRLENHALDLDSRSMAPGPLSPVDRKAVSAEASRVTAIAGHLRGVLLLRDNGTEVLDATLDGSTWTVDHLVQEGLALSIATFPELVAHPGISFDLFPCDNPDCKER